ncbi:MAG: hypothetical protein HKN68_04630 [Saprospiraceae bacterium]|nr:hypothetical protein [Saprospiraceae bacterium]
MRKTCKLCKHPFAGRSDKVFCTVKCKSTYHQKLNIATRNTTRNIDKILHRNRSILLEIMGKNAYQKKVPKFILDKKKFNYSYCTGIHINKHNKMYHNVYDFAWMDFSSGEVLIIRRNT